MDIEKKQNPVVKEYKLQIKTSKLGLNLVTFPMQTKGQSFKTSKVSYQPTNQKLNMEFQYD